MIKIHFSIIMIRYTSILILNLMHLIRTERQFNTSLIIVYQNLHDILIKKTNI